jgi:serine/threonine protein kinase
MKDWNVMQNTRHTQRCGTRAYMAPEVSDSSNYDESCDVFSLGCIMADLFLMEKDAFGDILFG